LFLPPWHLFGIFLSQIHSQFFLFCGAYLANLPAGSPWVTQQSTSNTAQANSKNPPKNESFPFFPVFFDQDAMEIHQRGSSHSVINICLVKIENWCPLSFRLLLPGCKGSRKQETAIPIWTLAWSNYVTDWHGLTFVFHFLASVRYLGGSTLIFFFFFHLIKLLQCIVRF
jgi:hypothetical protein